MSCCIGVRIVGRCIAVRIVVDENARTGCQRAEQGDPSGWGRGLSCLGRGRQTHTGNMTKYRNYWIYSIGCFVVWGVIFAVVAAEGKSDKTHTVLLVFAGWVIAWISGTIARFVYPPPGRWLPSTALEPGN
jgi:hypothetical protein